MGRIDPFGLYDDECGGVDLLDCYIGEADTLVEIATGAGVITAVGKALAKKSIAKACGDITKDAAEAAKRLGVKLDDITINNGVARTKIDISSTLDPKDINQLKDVLKSRGATRAEVDTGFIANEKLEVFLRRRVQDGKPFNGGTVRISNSKNSDFTIDFDLK